MLGRLRDWYVSHEEFETIKFPVNVDVAPFYTSTSFKSETPAFWIFFCAAVCGVVITLVYIKYCRTKKVESTREEKLQPRGSE